MNSRPHHFLETLERLHERSLERGLKFKEILDILGDKSHGLVLVFICLPFIQPIPLPMLSTPMGFVIIVISFFGLMNRKPWIPKSLAEKEISSKLLLRMTEVAQWGWSKLEKVIAPRWDFVFRSRGAQIFNFTIVVLSALLLALPIPFPMSNKVASIPILLNALGQLEEDGVLVMISYLTFVFAVAFFGSIGVGAMTGWDYIVQYFY